MNKKVIALISVILLLCGCHAKEESVRKMHTSAQVMTWVAEYGWGIRIKNLEYSEQMLQNIKDYKGGGGLSSEKIKEMEEHLGRLKQTAGVVDSAEANRLLAASLQKVTNDPQNVASYFWARYYAKFATDQGLISRLEALKPEVIHQKEVDDKKYLLAAVSVGGGYNHRGLD